MEELCQDMSEVSFDMESKFYCTVPYDSDEPDFDLWDEFEDESSSQATSISLISWNKNVNNNDTESCSTQSEEVKYNIIEQLNANSDNKDFDVRGMSETKKKVKSSRESIISSSNNSGDSDVDIEIVRKHRRLCFNSCDKDNRGSSDGTSRTSVHLEGNVYSEINSTTNSCMNSVNSSPLLNSTYPPSSMLVQSPTVLPGLARWKRKSCDNATSVNLGGHFTPPSDFKKRSFNYVHRDSAMPIYKGYQLLGDSQLVRFSEQLLNYNRRHVTYTDMNARRIGYCVSGQKIGDLELRLSRNECKLIQNVVLLIGTNDMNQRTGFEAMCSSYNNILSMLKPKTKRIVLLTVPPLPRYANNRNHWRILMELNAFIKSLADGVKIFVVDVASAFISYNNSTSNEYFEESLVNKFGSRKDLIHLNESGFKLLKAILDIHYFNKLT